MGLRPVKSINKFSNTLQWPHFHCYHFLHLYFNIHKITHMPTQTHRLLYIEDVWFLPLCCKIVHENRQSKSFQKIYTFEKDLKYLGSIY